MPARDQPLQTYFPSARVRLIVRLEDFGATDTPPPPPKPTTLRKGVTSKSTQQLDVKLVDGAYVLAGPGDDPSHLGSPQQQQTSGDGRTFVLDGVIPNQASHQQNGIRTADTLSCQIAFRDMPVDPRLVRSCAVQYFLGCVSAEEYERGINGQTRPPQNGSNVALPFNVVPDGYTDPYGQPRTNLRFEGWVDEWADEFDDEDAPALKLDCTDNTRLLIDQDAPPKLTISTDQPLDLAIATYLANFPQFRGLSIVYQPSVDRSKIPVLKKVLKATSFQPKLGPAPSGGGTSKLKVWDYLTDVCGSVGHIVRFEGVQIIIQTPRTLYDASLPVRPDDPFRGRVLPSGVQLRNRLFLYGNNIAKLKYQRKYARFAPTNFEVRAYDSSKKTVLVARYPQKGDRVKRLNPGDSADEKWSVIQVSRIQDVPTLRLIAQSAYEQQNRCELGVNVQTKNLGSYGGGNLDPDMLDARPGDPIDIQTAPSSDESDNTPVSIAEQLHTRGSAFLRELGFGDKFSDAYGEAAGSIGLPSTYRIRTLGTQWDGESDGVSITAELVNYVEVRADKQLPAGEEVQASDVSADPGTSVTVSDTDIGLGV